MIQCENTKADLPPFFVAGERDGKGKTQSGREYKEKI
jgi:hypothetical protein